MKIDDVVKKCIEMPGVSLNQRENSMELLLNRPEGRGSMNLFPIFSGITLAYIFVYTPTWPAPILFENGSNAKGPFIINYCIRGRCELICENENYVYVTEGQISLTDHYAQDQYIYPRSLYEGLELFLDLDSVEQNCPDLYDLFGLDLRGLPQRYCQEQKIYIADACPRLTEIFQALWGLYDENDAHSVLQRKVHTLSLLSLLLHEKNMPPPQTCTFYTASQVEIAKKVERIITADLRQHYPARELAETFSISQTSLKNYFRGVFQQNISAYLRDARMNRAAELLASTQLSVAEIAEQVGYSNQSKFAAVFKKQYDISPLEYRRRKRLEHSNPRFP